MVCYIRQSGRGCNICYNENTHAICNNNEKSGYLQQIWNTLHSFGALENTSNVLDAHIKHHFFGAASKIIINLLVLYLM
jgi:hypothetical protein